MREGSDFFLPDTEGNVHSIRHLPGPSNLLLIFVSAECDVSRKVLRALVGDLSRVVVVVQGHMVAAQRLKKSCGLAEVRVLVERRPYSFSRFLEIKALPTLVLMRQTGNISERRDGWLTDDRTDLLEAVGAAIDERLDPGVRPGCTSRSTLNPQMQELLEEDDLQDADWSSNMWNLGWTDGLPVVEPSEDAVEHMLGGRDSSKSLGNVPPSGGELTLERLAVCAVLAGCTPSHFPVVVAAAEAVLDEAINLAAIQTTTHSASCILLVNGPIRHELAFNMGQHALGPGSRSNLTIGRAVRLMMTLTGGAELGKIDPSPLGGPHKIGMCIAENQELSPWPPYHTDIGFSSIANVVTAFVGYGPIVVEDHLAGNPRALVRTMARHLRPTVDIPKADCFLILCPRHARVAAATGWSKHDFVDAVVAEVLKDVEQTAMPESSTEHGLRVIVAGGDNGGFSALLSPWGGFQLDSCPISREIEAEEVH